LAAARRGKTLAGWSTGAFITGAALAGAGTTLLLLGRSSAPSTSLRVTVSPMGVALLAEL
jgi:hypothetical protein